MRSLITLNESGSLESLTGVKVRASSGLATERCSRRRMARIGYDTQSRSGLTACSRSRCIGCPELPAANDKSA